MIEVDTIADLKAIPPSSLSVGDLAFVKGFASPGDGAGDFFQHNPYGVSNSLDGVLFNSNDPTGSWAKLNWNAGHIHDQWAGVFANSVDSFNVFDPDGHASSNRQRVNALLAFCGHPIYKIGGLNSMVSTTNSVQFGGGMRDMDGGQIIVPPGVSVYGTGQASTTIRFSLTDTAQACMLCDGGSAYGFGNTFEGFTLTNYRWGASMSSSLFGIQCKNMVRGLVYRDFVVSGFGRNIAHNDVWEYEMYNVTSRDGAVNNLRSYGNVCSAKHDGCRFDDCLGPENVSFEDPNNSSFGVEFTKTAIQRSNRIGVMLKGIRSAKFDTGTHFEGNNRDNSSSPDIWFEPRTTAVIDLGNTTFTRTGRGTVVNSRALSVRSNTPAGCKIITRGCSVVDNSFGTFIDVDTPNPIDLAGYQTNNVGSVPSVLPSNVNHI